MDRNPYDSHTRPLRCATATFPNGANQIRLARRRADQNSAGGGWRLFWRRQNSVRPREWRHITLLVSLSMENMVSTASVVTVGYFGSQNGANLGKWGSKY